MKNRVKAALAQYGVNINIDDEVTKLTGEERQILAIARAVDIDPQILLLDESFTFLSIEGRQRVADFIKKINREKCITVIVVSHDLDLIKYLSDYIMVLRQGRKVFYGPADQLSVDDIVAYMLGTYS
jgi:ABC-type sugar transport system ATPase subunit